MVFCVVLLQLVRIHFGQAVAAVGFEQGEAGLFELVLLLVALAADVVVLLLQLGRSFAQYGDVVFEAV